MFGQKCLENTFGIPEHYIEKLRPLSFALGSRGAALGHRLHTYVLAQNEQINRLVDNDNSHKTVVDTLSDMLQHAFSSSDGSKLFGEFWWTVFQSLQNQPTRDWSHIVFMENAIILDNLPLKPLRADFGDEKFNTLRTIMGMSTVQGHGTGECASIGFSLLPAGLPAVDGIIPTSYVPVHHYGPLSPPKPQFLALSHSSGSNSTSGEESEVSMGEESEHSKSQQSESSKSQENELSKGQASTLSGFQTSDSSKMPAVNGPTAQANQPPKSNTVMSAQSLESYFLAGQNVQKPKSQDFKAPQNQIPEDLKNQMMPDGWGPPLPFMTSYAPLMPTPSIALTNSMSSIQHPPNWMQSLSSFSTSPLWTTWADALPETTTLDKLTAMHKTTKYGDTSFNISTAQQTQVGKNVSEEKRKREQAQELIYEGACGEHLSMGDVSVFPGLFCYESVLFTNQLLIRIYYC